MRDPAPLLTDAAVANAREIGAAIRAQRVAPLVGAGLSQRAGLPGWGATITRVFAAWQAWDAGRLAALGIGPEAYAALYQQLFRRLFPDNPLALVSYLRQQVAHRTSGVKRVRRHRSRRPARLRNQLEYFEQLVYTAIYTRSLQTGELFVPQARRDPPASRGPL